MKKKSGLERQKLMAQASATSPSFRPAKAVEGRMLSGGRSGTRGPAIPRRVQDPRFHEHVPGERLRELYDQTCERAALLVRLEAEGTPYCASRRLMSLPVVEFGQILNELISARSALAGFMDEKKADE
jgi:hypothetical protein